MNRVGRDGPMPKKFTEGITEMGTPQEVRARKPVLDRARTERTQLL